MDKLRILVVEDESISAMRLKKQIENHGFEVVGTVAYGQEAITLSQSTNPDLVLMDIQLKGDMTGIEAAKQIWKKQDIPIIFLTAYSDSDTMDQAKLSDPYGYIIKPYEVQQLFCNVEVAMHKHRITLELKKAQEEVAKKNKHLEITNELLAKYIDIAHHELREPICVILPYTEMLIEDCKGWIESAQLNYLEGIKKHGLQINSVIDRLTDIKKEADQPQ
ncbi:MAG: response regulator [Candidatus Margulisbacteria bacterium]|nr:response regulator [Candidatus Margulisiibacteriota bacterium]